MSKWQLQAGTSNGKKAADRASCAPEAGAWFMSIRQRQSCLRSKAGVERRGGGQELYLLLEQQAMHAMIEVRHDPFGHVHQLVLRKKRKKKQAQRKACLPVPGHGRSSNR